MVGPAARHGDRLFLGILPGGGVAVVVRRLQYREEGIAPLGRVRQRRDRGRDSARGGKQRRRADPFIPMLSLGVPSNVVMALMIGAMIIQGIVPGPNVITKNPDPSGAHRVDVGRQCVMLIVLNLPLVGIWVKLLSIPYTILFRRSSPSVASGAYSVGNSSFAVFEIAAAGLIGYLLVKLDCELAPLHLASAGPMLRGIPAPRDHLRRRSSVFRHAAVNAGLLLLAAIALVFVSLPAISEEA